MSGDSTLSFRKGDLVKNSEGFFGIIRYVSEYWCLVFWGNGIENRCLYKDIQPVLIPSSTAHCNFAETLKPENDVLQSLGPKQ